MAAPTSEMGRMRFATYLVAALGVLAWGIPVVIIIRIFAGLDTGVFALLARLSGTLPYGRLAVMCSGVLFSLLAPIWLSRRGCSHWALASAILSFSTAFLFVYLSTIVAMIQTGR